jgi:transcriptional regulator with XRE-family HTH domain
MVNIKQRGMTTKQLFEALGEEVRQRRERLPLTQKAFAKDVRLHVNAVGRIERGTGNPTARTLVSIANRFDITLSELFACAERRMR